MAEKKITPRKPTASTASGGAKGAATRVSRKVAARKVAARKVSARKVSARKVSARKLSAR